MPPHRRLKPQPLLDEPALLDFLSARSIPPLHARRLWQRVCQTTVGDDISSIPDIPRSLLDAFDPHEFRVLTSTLVSATPASDGSTTKLLIRLQDGHLVEAVVIRYGQPRLTLCVSSQIGCRMGCTFCATGTMDLLGSMTAGEILEQIVHAQRLENARIRNVVFMGMGEPLDNYDAVRTAVGAMLDPGRFGMQGRRVTISTVGVVPRLVAMKSDPHMSKCSLALSLHGGDQETRLRIIPTAKAWDIRRIVDASSAFVEAQNHLERDTSFRHLLVEYILIRDVNSSPCHAAVLADLLGSLPLAHLTVFTNLIPYNPVQSITARLGYRPPPFAEINAFAAVLKERGLKVLVRQEMGSDVGSACGQLVVEGAGKRGSGEHAAVADIEELGNGRGAGLRNRKGGAVVRRNEPAAPASGRGADGEEQDGADEEISLLPPEARLDDGFAPVKASHATVRFDVRGQAYSAALMVMLVLVALKIAVRLAGLVAAGPGKAEGR
ncbi:hypothetical protein DFJ74DRAFT_633297 [Hyaloraphidium curvatum]|nr:hypothetical protein DFJ74DRAFT_633297 [Hyaloraphidium curvatum]